jgi:outer membrane lipoprotein-sorting protein
MGGRAAMEKLTSRSATGTLTIGTPAGDIAGTVEIVTAAPNRQRTLLKADLSAFSMPPLSVDQRFDGTNGYVMDSMQGNREITGSQLTNMKANAFPHPFLNYKAQGLKVELKGKEQVAGREAFLVIFQPAQGNPIKQYIDAQTFLPVRTVVRAEVPGMGEIEQYVDPSDFRDVNGIKEAHKVTLTNSEQTVTMTLTKIEHNVPVDPKLFVKP